MTLQQVIDSVTSARPIDPTPDDGAGVIWRAHTLGLESGAVLGGELLAQSLYLAAQVDTAMPVSSIVASFPRGVRDTGSLDFTASTLHRGSAYSTQRVEVVQPDRTGTLTTAYTATVLCRREVAGVEHGLTRPAAAGAPGEGEPLAMGLVPWQHRVAGSTDLNDRAAQANEYLLWTRVPEPLPDDPALHQALLAHLSDLTLIGTALLPHEGWSQLDCHVALRTSVIAHQIVFHRPFRIDDWLLLSHTSPASSGGTAFGVAQVFTAGGEHVATISQQSMIRVEQERHS